MKDSTKDTFEEFIEKSLKDYEEDPSDFLWAELEHNIPPPPNNPFPFLGLTVFSVTILLSIVGALFYFNSKAEDVDLSLQNQDVKINEIAKEVERITNQLKTSNTATSAKFQNEEKEISTKKNEKNQGNEKNEISKKEIKQYNYNNTHDNKKRSIVEIKNSTSIKNAKINNILFQESVSNSLKNTNEIKASSEKKHSILPKLKSNIFQKQEVTTKSKSLIINDVEGIPMLDGKIYYEESERKLNSIDPVELLGYTKKIGFEFFTTYGETYPNIKFESPIYSFQKIGSKNIDLGLVYNIQLSQRLLFQIGVGFTNRSISSRFTKSMTYSNFENPISLNEYQSENIYQVNSNYGNQLFTSHFITTKFNDGFDIQSGEVFVADLTVVRTQKYFSVPIFLKYTISDLHKKIRWTVKGGMMDRIYFNVNDSGIVDFENISHPRLKHNFTEVENVGHGQIPTRYGIELVLGTGMEYHIHRNFRLVIEPIFKTNILERTNVNPYTFGIYSGIRWMFKR